ncbi:hypothetical protein J3F83DRAFT_416157 [Trichoderma novae-zelandiae]
MNMVEQQQYIPAGLPHTGGLAGSHSLSEARSIAPAGTSAYPEVAPFSAVSSFNVPAPCDSSLLTPISTANSPPLHHIRKLAPQYPPSTPYTQVPTPPGSSKMYHQPWSSQFDMHAQSAQNPAPMNNQVPVTSEFYMTPDDRRSTPNPPTEPYYGSFSVSEGADTHSMHQQGPQSYYMPIEMENQGSNMMIRDPRHLTMEPHPRDMDRTHAPSLLAQSHFNNARRASTDDRSYSSRADNIRRSSSGSPRRRSIAQGSSRVKKSRSSKRQGASFRSQQQVDPGEEHKNCFGQEAPPLIKKNCPEEERCIFESRWRHRHQRGQDMWDSIQGDFDKRFDKRHGKEMLQMKFKRGRAKYYEWLDEDVKILRAAFKKLEKDRYSIILNNFLEMGGSRNMLLSPSDIEIKIVNELKWEESIYIEGMEECIRRRRKTIVKKRSTGRGEPGGEVAVSDDMLRISQAPHNEDDDMASVNGEMMDSHMWENRAPMKMETEALMPSGSEHMARVHNGASQHPIGNPCIRPVSSAYHPMPKAP